MSTPTDDGGGDVMDRVTREKLVELSNVIARALNGFVPDGVGFGLLLFHFAADDADADRFMAWISNANREDMIRAFREQLRTWESELG